MTLRDRFILTMRYLKTHYDMVTAVIMGSLLAAMLGLAVYSSYNPQVGEASLIKDRDTGRTLRWEDLSQLTYWIDPQIDEIEVRDAADGWNEALKGTVFVQWDEESSADVIIRPNIEQEPNTPDSVANTKLYHTSNSSFVQQAVISLFPRYGILGSTAKTLVITHELGHALTLDDSTHPACIMKGINPTRGPCPAEIDAVNAEMQE